jgi:hypothetical protein
VQVVSSRSQKLTPDQEAQLAKLRADSTSLWFDKRAERVRILRACHRVCQLLATEAIDRIEVSVPKDPEKDTELQHRIRGEMAEFQRLLCDLEGEL